MGLLLVANGMIAEADIPHLPKVAPHRVIIFPSILLLLLRFRLTY